MVAIKPHLTSPSDGGLRARHLPRLMCAIVVACYFLSTAHAQKAQHGPALNEFTTWFGGQLANKHAFSDTVNGLYQLESRYSSLVYAGGPVAVRWVANKVPMTLVGDPRHTTARRYAYGGGGSPIGAQVNRVRYSRIEPLLTPGMDFFTSTGARSAERTRILRNHANVPCRT